MNTQKYDLLQKVPPFRVVGKVGLGAIDMKETLKCFPRHARRDTLNGLPVKQPRTDPCTVWTIAVAKNSTYEQLASYILDMPENTPRSTRVRLLASRGHVMTIAQAEMIAETMRGVRARVFFFTMNARGGFSRFAINPTVSKDILYTDTDLLPQAVDRILVRNLNASWPWV
ncbi:MAG: hypothetical protein G01um101491_362 [Parcubacteria group bacterium Gr01-1014_91]|nr:MAG: hypothetical protein G01um101491_362 [Parcubacteria group bacterium Gr01-1014_91]